MNDVNDNEARRLSWRLKITKALIKGGARTPRPFVKGKQQNRGRAVSTADRQIYHEQTKGQRP